MYPSKYFLGSTRFLYNHKGAVGFGSLVTSSGSCRTPPQALLCPLCNFRDGTWASMCTEQMLFCGFTLAFRSDCSLNSEDNQTFSKLMNGSKSVHRWHTLETPLHVLPLFYAKSVCIGRYIFLRYQWRNAQSRADQFMRLKWWRAVISNIWCYLKQPLNCFFIDVHVRHWRLN